MILRTVDLYQECNIARGAAKRGYLTLYLHEDLPELRVHRSRPAMLVIPGGAYAFLSQREGTPVATEFYAAGYQTFLLDYDIAPAHYPAQILQAAMAMLYIRRNAALLGVAQSRVAAAGFSAGGHLLGCISAIWDDPALRAAFGDECVSVRPDASVYGYPVVSCDPAVAHADSFKNFCGDAVRAEDYSIDRRVGNACSPAFIWANTPDDLVTPENALLLYRAYLRAGVRAELHIFRDGRHGMSVCTAECDERTPLPAECGYVRPWLDLCKNFLGTLGFTVC